jgi:monoamine oxidase
MFRRMRRLVRIAYGANLEDLRADQIPERLQMSQGRRAFLRNSALAVAGAAIAGRMSLAGVAAAAMGDPHDPVLILGAGAAGLAAAYRLKKAGVPYLLVEAQSRVGGRIWTSRNFNADGQFVELGAELVDTPHYVLQALAAELKQRGHDVGIEYFAGPDNGLDEDVFLIDGVSYTAAEFIDGVRPLAAGLAAEYARLFAGGNPDEDEISYRTAGKLKNAAEYDRMSIRQLLAKLSSPDIPAWVIKAVDVAYLGEYGIETEDQPSINLLYLLNQPVGDNAEFDLFGESDEVARVAGGNQRLIDALYDELTDGGKSTDHVVTGQALNSIRFDTQSRRFLLQFANSVETRIATRVICTIPFTILRDTSKVQGVLDLPLTPVKKECIARLGMGRNAKLFLTFKDRRWRQKDERGLVPGTGKVRPNTGSIISNTASQAFWETSRLQGGERGILTNFLGGARGLASSDATAEAALTDLDLLYPGISGSFEARTADLDPRIPGVRQCMNWNRNPYVMGSYACVMMGQWTTIWGAAGEAESLLPPERLSGAQPSDLRLFFAGEHTSMSFQGFMEGGYESGTRAAEEVIASLSNSAEAADPYAWAKQVLGIP